ncbi:MAG: hypothetical protein CMO81_09755 [Waddliaceae bacterium]|nr:hypothetical protein [Waddliaceae bacterium]
MLLNAEVRYEEEVDDHFDYLEDEVDSPPIFGTIDLIAEAHQHLMSKKIDDIEYRAVLRASLAELRSQLKGWVSATEKVTAEAEALNQAIVESIVRTVEAPGELGSQQNPLIKFFRSPSEITTLPDLNLVVEALVDTKVNGRRLHVLKGVLGAGTQVPWPHHSLGGSDLGVVYALSSGLKVHAGRKSRDLFIGETVSLQNTGKWKLSNPTDSELAFLVFPSHCGEGEKNGLIKDIIVKSFDASCCIPNGAWPQFALGGQKKELELVILQHRDPDFEFGPIGHPGIEFSLNEVRVQEGCDHDLHYLSKQHQVHYLLEGRAQYFLDNESYVLEQGQAVSFPARTHVMVRNLGKGVLRYLLLDDPYWRIENDYLYSEFYKREEPFDEPVRPVFS